MGDTTTAVRTPYGHNAASYAAQFGRPLGDAVAEYAATGGDMSPVALAAALDLTRTAARRAAKAHLAGGSKPAAKPAQSRGATIATTGGVIIAETRHVDITSEPAAVEPVEDSGLAARVEALEAQLAAALATIAGMTAELGEVSQQAQFADDLASRAIDALPRELVDAAQAERDAAEATQNIAVF